MEYKNELWAEIPLANKIYSALDSLRLFVYILMFIFISACGSSSEEDSGLCKLSCGKSKIGDSVGMTVTPLFDDQAIYYCSAAAASTPFPRPLAMRFKVETEVDGTLYGKENPVKVPAQGLAFNVITLGPVFYPGGSSTENGILSTNGFEPTEYTGIATPMSEWCTDSCGVLTVQVWPQCPGLSETVAGSVVLTSGSLSGTLPVTVQTGSSALAPNTKGATAQSFEDLLHSFNTKLYHIKDMGKLRLY